MMTRSDRIVAVLVAGLFAIVVGGMTYLMAPRSTGHATSQYAAEPLP